MNTRRSTMMVIGILALGALAACGGSVDSGTGGTSTTTTTSSSSSSGGGTGGSSACDDYAAKAQGCCDKLTDADKTSCEASLKSIQDLGYTDACEAALDALGTTCD